MAWKAVALAAGGASAFATRRLMRAAWKGAKGDDPPSNPASRSTTWGEALPKQVAWLIEATRDREWSEVLPRGAQYLKFDYEAEDELVRSLAA